MMKRFVTILGVSTLGIIVVLYLTNENSRSQINYGSPNFLLKTTNLPQVVHSKDNKFENEDDLVNELEKHSKTRKPFNGARSEHDQITAEELEDFHDKNDEEFDKINEIDIGINKDKGNRVHIEKTLNTPKTTPTLLESQTPSINGIKMEGKLKKRFPQAIIAGVKKCGTRALLSFVGRHPLVKSAGMEMHFFDKNDTYQEGLDWYLDQMPESYENQVTIEKTPGYYVKPYVPKRVYEFSKTVKLIFIYREPVERAISDYTQALANEKDVKFEKLILTKTKPRKINEKSSKVDIGIYSKHLMRWLQYFPKKQMHFVNGDEFIKNPVPQLIEVQKFLELPVLLDERHFVFNKTKGFYCVKDTDETDGKCLGDSKGRTHPTVKRSARRKLKDFYKFHNEVFFNLIGKNFGWPTTKYDPEENYKT
eukprot:TCONS_00004322-protein